MRKLVLSTVLAALLAGAGVANATTATTSYDFASFTLSADLSSFAGTNVTKTANGFTFGGYNIGATPVENVIDFTITAKTGYKFDSMSFLDQGSFTGKGKFVVNDSFSNMDVANANKVGQTWSFSATNATSASGTVDYTLQSKLGYAGVSTGGAFSVVTAPVPEPETYAMLLAGLGLMGTIARRRNKSKAV